MPSGGLDSLFVHRLCSAPTEPLLFNPALRMGSFSQANDMPPGKGTTAHTDDGKFIPTLFLLGVSDSMADPQSKQLTIDSFCHPTQAHSTHLLRLAGSLLGSNNVNKPSARPHPVL